MSLKFSYFDSVGCDNKFNANKSTPPFTLISINADNVEKTLLTLLLEFHSFILELNADK
jgi:hypothetical protein